MNSAPSWLRKPKIRPVEIVVVDKIKGHTKIHLLNIYAPWHGIIVDPSTVFLGLSLDHRHGLVEDSDNNSTDAYQSVAITLEVDAGVDPVPARAERRLEVGTTWYRNHVSGRIRLAYGYA